MNKVNRAARAYVQQLEDENARLREKDKEREEEKYRLLEKETRLREALETITRCNSGPSHEVRHPGCQACAAASIARNALKEET